MTIDDFTDLPNYDKDDIDTLAKMVKTTYIMTQKSARQEFLEILENDKGNQQSIIRLPIGYTFKMNGHIYHLYIIKRSHNMLLDPFKDGFNQLVLERVDNLISIKLQIHDNITIEAISKFIDFGIDFLKKNDSFRRINNE